MRILQCCVLVFFLLGSTIGDVASRKALSGPIEAEVVDVYDGDTFTVDAYIWLDQQLRIKVRLNGIDTPELRTRCVTEKSLAKAARTHTLTRIGGKRVLLHDIQYGKYAGRVLARVLTPDGEDLASSLIKAGLARVYHGGKRTPWCAEG